MAADTHPPDAPDYGNRVDIRHPNGYLTIYAHLLPNTITVRVGDAVEAGQLLGKSDNTGKSTGPHLHFEVRDSRGRRVNPYGDPPDYAGGCGPGALWATCPPTPASSQDVNADGDGYTVAQGDCDDQNHDIHPGAEERCDGKDNDCDGTTDDPWRDGLAQDIGNPCTVGRGACARTGQWICAPDGRATVCDATSGTPSTESCNGLDDDCDGITDNPWRAGLAQDIGNPCTTTRDACRVSYGTWTCAPDGRSTVCDAPEPTGTPASAEVCNGIDDDCNGAVDDVRGRGSVVALSDTEHANPPYPYAVAYPPDAERFGVVLHHLSGSGLPNRTLVFQLLDSDARPIGQATTPLGPGEDVLTSNIAWDGEGYTVVGVSSAPDVPGTGMLRIVWLHADGTIRNGPVSVTLSRLIEAGMHSKPRPDIGVIATDDRISVALKNASTRNLEVVHLAPDGTLREAPRSVHADPEYPLFGTFFEMVRAGDHEVVVWVERAHEFSPPRIAASSWSPTRGWEHMTITGYIDHLDDFTVACAGTLRCVIGWTAWDSIRRQSVVRLHRVRFNPSVVSPPETWSSSDFMGTFRLACAPERCFAVFTLQQARALISQWLTTEDGWPGGLGSWVMSSTSLAESSDAVPTIGRVHAFLFNALYTPSFDRIVLARTSFCP